MLVSLVAVAFFIVAFIHDRKQRDDPERKDHRVAIFVFFSIALLVAYLLDLFSESLWLGV
jgi:multisubunit Na+/H+ antiporter MnhB subunit